SAALSVRLRLWLRLLCFVFQAEDGIRDRNVTGVQTCALPIFTHFVIKVVTFTCTLSDSSKNRNTTVFLGNVVNQLLNKNCFTNTCTTKQTDLSTFNIWSK